MIINSNLQYDLYCTVVTSRKQKYIWFTLQMCIFIRQTRLFKIMPVCNYVTLIAACRTQATSC